MSLRDDLKKEKKKLSRLSFVEKLQYIFDYYKFWMLGAVVLVGLVWSVGSTILHNKPTGFYAMLLNAGGTDLSGQADEAAGKAFAEAAGLDDTKYKILVDTSATFNPNDQSQFSMAQNAKIAALYQSHDIDVMVADPGVFTYYALNGSFVDLRDALDEETLAGYEASGQVYYIDQHVQELLNQTDYGELDEMSAFAANLMGLATVQPREDFVMPDPEKMQTPIPVGIVLADAPWFEENALYQKTTPIFGFAVKSERQDEAKSFLEFVQAK